MASSRPEQAEVVAVQFRCPETGQLQMVNYGSLRPWIGHSGWEYIPAGWIGPDGEALHVEVDAGYQCAACGQMHGASLYQSEDQDFTV
jgi:hypothetical protein